MYKYNNCRGFKPPVNGCLTKKMDLNKKASVGDKIRKSCLP